MSTKGKEKEEKTMKKFYWIREDGRTNVTYNAHEDEWMIKNGWRKISKAEYESAADKILRKWAKANGMG